MRTALIALTALVLPCVVSSQQVKNYPLESAAGLRLHNVAAEAATLDGKRGVRLTVSPDLTRRLQTLTPEQQQQLAQRGTIDGVDLEQLAVIEGPDFSSGVIEAEIAGAPAADAGVGARGFVGIAFRVQPDVKTYDAFYLRPTNGRADDQERRNHATQYISHPDWPWFRLRQETPGRYESYVDLLPNVWTKIKIEVRGDHARLYVNDNPQPVLIVNDVKTGATARGSVALWIGPGTIAHFRTVTVTPGQ
ncbi:MAG TPA: hypothetical protein VGQ29_08045 [Gemmatimonadales bacterium]|nr:hypothetical protein [Gemmatimonadales bacterium]